VSKEIVVESFTEAVRSSSGIDQSAFVLLNSVLAIGCQNASRKHQMNAETQHRMPKTGPLQYFQWALSSRHVLVEGQPTMLKLKVRSILARSW
jgi:hypothetical protein